MRADNYHRHLNNEANKKKEPQDALAASLNQVGVGDDAKLAGDDANTAMFECARGTASASGAATDLNTRSRLQVQKSDQVPGDPKLSLCTPCTINKGDFPFA